MIERRLLGLVDYDETFLAMKAFTQNRAEDTPDELWLLEHPAVFTQGVAGKATHLLAPGDIPVVKIDRGGQVTYHGPGQWVVYVLLDIRRGSLTVRGLVTAIERAVISLLAQYGIQASADPKAPGVYVEGRKIAALGLKVSRGCSYHGVALNVDMNLEPFRRINPCGHAGLEVISMASLLGADALDKEAIGQALLDSLEYEFSRSAI
ncbi:MAG: lipoyl(octanoyl) transferase LipB [Luminiphilus sp.]|nr:lipoyl(octanoyl) transferase LipB [Luminiphilus sp.]MDG1461190.1 lipoyl(octanoyl) transferase LipB [Luminiphilus sp.]